MVALAPYLLLLRLVCRREASLIAAQLLDRAHIAPLIQRPRAAKTNHTELGRKHCVNLLFEPWASACTPHQHVKSGKHIVVT